MQKTILFQNVSLLEADVNYTIVHFANGNKSIYSYSLKYFEKFLKTDPSFVRIHKSYLVNRQYIREIKPRPISLVVLLSGMELPLARRRKF